jgi:hypothetical protein
MYGTCACSVSSLITRTSHPLALIRVSVHTDVRSNTRATQTGRWGSCPQTCGAKRAGARALPRRRSTDQERVLIIYGLPDFALVGRLKLAAVLDLQVGTHASMRRRVRAVCE